MLTSPNKAFTLHFVSGLRPHSLPLRSSERRKCSAVICKYLAIKTLRGKKNYKTAKPKVFKCENEKILKDIKEESQ